MSFLPQGSVTGRNFTGTFANRSVLVPSPSIGDTYQCSDGYEFEWNGTIWRPKIQGVLGTAPPPAAQFTIVTPAGVPPTIADAAGALLYTIPGNVNLNTELLAVLENGVNGCTQPTGNLSEISVAFQNALNSNLAQQSYLIVAPEIRNAAGNSASLSNVQAAGPAGQQNFTYFTVVGTGFPQFNDFSVGWAGPIFTRVRTDGVTVFWEWSRNPNAPANAWTALHTEAFGTVFPAGPPTQSAISGQIAAFSNMGDNRYWVRHFKTA